MTGKKSFFMLSTILLVSFALMVFIAGTEPHTSQVSTNPIGDDPLQSLEDSMSEPKSLTAAIAVTPNEYRIIRQLTHELHSQKHDLRVHIENVDDDLYSWLKSAVQSGEAPDIMLLENEWVYDFASSGLLLPVDEVFKREEHAEHFSQVMSQLRWNGYTWGVPKEVDPYVLVWNSNAMEALGLPAPETKEQILAAIERFHLDEKIGIFVNIEDVYAVISLYSLLNEEEEHAMHGWEYSAQDRSIDDKEEDEEEGSIEDRWSNVVERWQEEWAFISENRWQAIKDEQLLMMIVPFSEYGKHADETLQFIPLQTLNDREDDDLTYVGLLKGKSFAISASTIHKNEALEWIAHMTTGDAQLDMLQAGSSIPVRSHTSELDALLHFPYHGKLWDAIELGVTFPAHPNLPEIVRNFRQLEDFQQVDKETILEFLNTINQWSDEDSQ